MPGARRWPPEGWPPCGRRRPPVSGWVRMAGWNRSVVQPAATSSPTRGRHRAGLPLDTNRGFRACPRSDMRQPQPSCGAATSPREANQCSRRITPLRSTFVRAGPSRQVAARRRAPRSILIALLGYRFERHLHERSGPVHPTLPRAHELHRHRPLRRHPGHSSRAPKHWRKR